MAASAWTMVVNGEIAEEQREAWDRWYDETHLPEILRCPGFVRAHRYVSAEGNRFMTVYELSDPAAMESAEFARYRGVGPFEADVTLTTGLFRLHRSMDQSTTRG